MEFLLDRSALTKDYFSLTLWAKPTVAIKVFICKMKCKTSLNLDTIETGTKEFILDGINYLAPVNTLDLVYLKIMIISIFLY